MPSREQKLQVAVNKLAKYYGLYNTGDLSRRISTDRSTDGSSGAGPTQLDQVQGGAQGDSSRDITTDDVVMRTIIQLFIDTSEGALTSFSFAKQIAEQMANASDEVKSRVRELIKCYGTNDQAFGVVQGVPEGEVITINGLLRYGEGQGSGINGNSSSEPTKDKPGLSITFSDSKRISQTGRHANAVCLFLNGMPNLEISKAVPYLNIEFLFNRPPVNDGNNRLQTPGLLKFLLGADVVPSAGAAGSASPYRSLALGNVTTQDTTSGRDVAQETYSVASMEMFTSPQTLVNADEVDREENRSNPVLDKFRPFMTIKEFEVNIVGTTGLANYKTAKLGFVLHDRTRLADVADFIRPDLYGRTELLIEYGWIHPDGERADTDNPYGDLINGMRCKEKYGVRNSSYTFDEQGQVIITLDLYMRGGTDTATEIISSDEESVGNVIREIEELQSTIADLRQRTFGTTGVRTREVRGIQILDAAQDAMSHSILSSDLRDELRQFRRSLATSDSPNITGLRDALNSLFGSEDRARRSRGAQTAGTGATGRLRTSVLSSIDRKVARMQGIDPFIIQNYPPTGTDGGRSRQLAAGRRGEEARREERAYEANFTTSVEPDAKVSLATLLLHFVGEPLANTHKFDDVQLIFYPFNSYAGFAANLNIGNFEVDLNYFAQEFARARLGNVGRSANMNLREFMSFIGQILIDDPAARSYGLWDDTGAFYREVFDGDGATRSTEAVDEVPALQQRMENLLRGVTPDGSFRMPQIEFYIECLPEKPSTADGVDSLTGSSKSILRFHVYDRHAGAYEGLGSILASSRDGQLEAVGRIPGGQPGNPSVSANSAADHAAFIRSAERYGIIERLRPDHPEDDPPAMYRIVGGPRKLKEFLYKTMPYIIYGVGGTLVKIANVNSQQNPELATVNMLRSFRRSELQPNGELPGGLPMRIIPTELSMQTLGCPLLVYTQQFFIDFQTGTSADNIYGITGISHRITEGEFTTDIRFAPFDAYGRYESFFGRIQNAQQVLDDISRRTPTPETSE
ncbi:MAG: hypothetical protein WC761_01490 [Candidatus Paceibacterota bacterium]|jgi:hypothetical protein